MVDDATVVSTAAEAAEDIIFSRYRRSEIDDYDVTVSFEEGTLEIDVYVDGPGDDDQLAEDAVLAARGAVDQLFN